MATFAFNIPDENLLFQSMLPVLRAWAEKQILGSIKSDYAGGGRDKFYPKKVSDIIYEKGNIRIEIDMNLVASCIELGRRAGKMPPISAIKNWIKIKHIVPRNKVTIDLLSFLIARSIGKHGTVGKHYLYDATMKAELPDELDEVIDKYFESFSMLEKLN